MCNHSCSVGDCTATTSALLNVQGVNIMAFCKEYNAQTSKMVGEVVPVEITVYEVRAAAKLVPDTAGVHEQAASSRDAGCTT